MATKTRLRTQADLAAALEVSQQRVSKLLKDAAWKWGRGPWTQRQVGQIKAFLAVRRAENNATAAKSEAQPHTVNLGDLVDPPTLLKQVPSAEKRIKLAATIERLKRQEFDREREMGLYLRKDQVEAGFVARVQAVRAELAMLRQLATRLVGKALAEVEIELDKWARGVCMKFERDE